MSNTVCFQKLNLIFERFHISCCSTSLESFVIRSWNFFQKCIHYIESMITIILLQDMQQIANIEKEDCHTILDLRI
jgi:hypothetical protein